MQSMDAELTARLTDAVARVVGGVTASIVSLDDERMLDLLRDASTARKALDLVIATVSAEIERRSSRDRGQSGLAQRKGHRTTTSLVQTITGQSRGDIGRALSTGREITEPAGATETAPAPPAWDAGLRAALVDGRIGQDHYRAIRFGLGEPPLGRYPDVDPAFLSEAWAVAVTRLLDEAAELTPEDLRASARIARDRLDPIGVTLRFEERYAARSFRAWIDESGQHHARITFDDEAAAWVHGILSAALRPRRGPRFVSSDEAVDSDVDERSNEQLQYDTLMAVLRTGAAADPNQAFGDRQPGVRIVVEESAIDDGVGHLEDGGAALPASTVQKFLCDAAAVGLSIDGRGRPLDLGRETRLFSRAQRIAIGARDGGCIAPHCTAPVSWCEFHHVDHWHADHGRTDVDDGVPLCRHHHLGLHNRGARIRRDRDPATGTDSYWWIDPPDPVTGRASTPRQLRSRSPRRFAAAG